MAGRTLNNIDAHTSPLEPYCRNIYHVYICNIIIQLV